MCHNSPVKKKNDGFLVIIAVRQFHESKRFLANEDKIHHRVQREATVCLENRNVTHLRQMLSSTTNVSKGQCQRIKTDSEEV